RVFDTFENLHDFKMASLEELQSIPGVGRVKSAQIKAMLELGRRIHLVNQQFGEKITSSYGVAQTLIEQMKDYKQEHLVVIYLNAQNAIIRQKTMFIGTLNSSIAHPREIYRDAVKFSASSLIIAHNHPSSDTKPSSSDVELTKQMQKAGQYLGIPLIDHLIIGHDDYYSFRENDKL
ncbi:MAG: DNA repair protein RadC, partial [Streptococcaceae bacterium]|nr:DNA repair protein RadC [Streptococcaceae bacterium]